MPGGMVPQGRIELPTSPLPRVRSTTELLRRRACGRLLDASTGSRKRNLDDLLRGIDNKQLVHVVREMAPNAAIIANAIATDEIQKVYDAGADYVYLNRFEAAWTLQRAIESGIEQQIDAFREKRQSRNHYKPDRKEILS